MGSSPHPVEGDQQQQLQANWRSRAANRIWSTAAVRPANECDHSWRRALLGPPILALDIQQHPCKGGGGDGAQEGGGGPASREAAPAARASTPSRPKVGAGGSARGAIHCRRAPPQPGDGAAIFTTDGPIPAAVGRGHVARGHGRPGRYTERTASSSLSWSRPSLSRPIQLARPRWQLAIPGACRRPCFSAQHAHATAGCREVART